MATRVTYHANVAESLLKGDQMAAYLEEIGARIVARAQDLAPVDTGALRDSITAEVEAGVLTVGSDLPYAAAQEFGTARIPAHPYLRPALDAGGA